MSLSPLGDCPVCFAAPTDAPDPYGFAVEEMEKVPAPRVHGAQYWPYAGGRGSAARQYPKSEGGPDLTLENLTVGQAVAPRYGHSDTARRDIDLFPHDVLPRFLNEVDLWTPYQLPVNAFGNPAITNRSRTIDVEATFKPALEPPRYDLTAQDTDDIVETAKRNIMLRLGLR